MIEFYKQSKSDDFSDNMGDNIMGEVFARFYKQRLKKEWKMAFFSTFTIALLIHMYKFANTLPNHDSVYNFYSDQNVLGSGRWALSLACGISSYYDLPWLNGLMSCLFIAMTVVVIVALFRLKNPVLIGLTGALLAASPSITETLFFEFTADGYFIAMMLAALAVYLSRIEEKRVFCKILSGVCICVSCGIYQAYVSFALVLAVCYFMDVLLQGQQDRISCMKWVLRQAIVYTAALGAYYGIWKLCMLVSGTTANDYQGISEVGKLDLGNVTGGFFRSLKTVILYFTQWNVLEHGLTFYTVLNIIFLLALAVGLVLACVKSGIYKKPWAMLLLVLCCAALVPFSCIWHFVSETIGYRAMMLTSLAMLFIMCAILYERWAKTGLKNAVCLLLMLIVFHNGIMANVSYYYMNLCYERTYAHGLEIMMEIHDQQDKHQIDAIAVLGERTEEVTLDFFDEETGAATPAGKLYMLSSLLEQDLLLDAEHTILYLREIFGLDLKSVTGSQLEALKEMEQVQEMGSWPANDSIAIIDGILVLKLADI